MTPGQIDRACWRALIFDEPLSAETLAAIRDAGGSGLLALIDGRSKDYGLAWGSRVYSAMRSRGHTAETAVRAAQRAVGHISAEQVQRECLSASGRVVRIRQTLPGSDYFDSEI
jgi:hypothetical protein